ncbi:hypothetical protein GCM10020331_001150 [Ectobacillus funiculus]
MGYYPSVKGKKGKTIMLTTHYMDEAHVLCDRIAIMDQGQLIALDTPSELVKKTFSLIVPYSSVSRLKQVM